MTTPFSACAPPRPSWSAKPARANADSRISRYEADRPAPQERLGEVTDTFTFAAGSQAIAPGPDDTIAADISAVLDNLVILRQFEEDHELQRSLSIQKMRESAFDTAARRLTFSPSGIMIGHRLRKAAIDPPGAPSISD